jgi:TPR repeat protein
MGGELLFDLRVDVDKGKGQPQDRAEAAHWHARPANDGFVHAFTALGMLSAGGIGVGKVDPVATQCLSVTAAAVGRGAAIFNRAELDKWGLRIATDRQLAMDRYAVGDSVRAPPV